MREIGDKQWALDVEARAKAGEGIPMLLRKIAESALGRALPKVPKGGLGHRPNHADRAAGDDSFDDENEAVPL